MFLAIVHRLSSLVAEDVGVTSLEDGEGGAAEELTAGGTELNVVPPKWWQGVLDNML